MVCERCGEKVNIGVKVHDWHGDRYRVCGECYEYIMDRYGTTKCPTSEFIYEARDDEMFPWEDEYDGGERVTELRFE